jgi:hypothetical protein
MAKPMEARHLHKPAAVKSQIALCLKEVQSYRRGDLYRDLDLKVSVHFIGTFLSQSP